MVFYDLFIGRVSFDSMIYCGWLHQLVDGVSHSNPIIYSVSRFHDLDHQLVDGVSHYIPLF